jgi:hypothetical protein
VRRRGGGVTGNFFVGERLSRSALSTELAVPFGEPSPGSAVAELRTARLAAREAESSRPAIRAFVDSVGVPWNTDLLGVRWRGVFGTPDLEWGHVRIVGPGEREIPAGATPGLLHVLSGRGEIRVADDSGISVATGSTLAFQPGEPIKIDFGDQGAQPSFGQFGYAGLLIRISTIGGATIYWSSRCPSRRLRLSWHATFCSLGPTDVARGKAAMSGPILAVDAVRQGGTLLALDDKFVISVGSHQLANWALFEAITRTV